ncbi:hypothetical protein BOTNAR_0143g00150 [Botryotinia narcissicola]|uniref:Uncharacterized protein n=1 Tax=Botryotinia narcissicola TaxID=278944 RepID=A0A4Z1IUT5_9HELO|nr:hypothetical protein BOTNAR_0143g00150 [Botryotinia narcissicola]
MNYEPQPPQPPPPPKLVMLLVHYHARNFRTRVSPKEVRDLQDMTSTYSRRYTTVVPASNLASKCPSFCHTMVHGV